MVDDFIKRLMSADDDTLWKAGRIIKDQKEEFEELNQFWYTVTMYIRNFYHDNHERQRTLGKQLDSTDRATLAEGAKVMVEITNKLEMKVEDQQKIISTLKAELEELKGNSRNEDELGD